MAKRNRRKYKTPKSPPPAPTSPPTLGVNTGDRTTVNERVGR